MYIYIYIYISTSQKRSLPTAGSPGHKPATASPPEPSQGGGPPNHGRHFGRAVRTGKEQQAPGDSACAQIKPGPTPNRCPLPTKKVTCVVMLRPAEGPTSDNEPEPIFVCTRGKQ